MNCATSVLAHPEKGMYKELQTFSCFSIQGLPSPSGKKGASDNKGIIVRSATPSKAKFLVDLLHSRATATSARRCTTTVASTRHATLRRSSRTTCCLVDLHHDRVHNALKLLLLGLKFVLLRKLVLIKPIKSLLHCLLDLVLVIALKLVVQLLLLQSVPHREAVVLQAILRLDLRLVRLILSLELLCL